MVSRSDGLTKEISRLVNYQRAHRPKKVANRTREQLSAEQTILSTAEIGKIFGTLAKDKDGHGPSPPGCPPVFVHQTLLEKFSALKLEVDWLGLQLHLPTGSGL